MARDKSKKGEKQEPKNFKEFLKKRAPIYLGITGLFILFVVPSLTAGSLEDSFPDDLNASEKQALDTLMAYNGPNQEGLNLKDALSSQIEEEYSDEKIFDKEDTKIEFLISNQDGNNFQINLTFDTYKENKEYIWNVNLSTNEVEAVNEDAKHIVSVVDYYD